MKTVVGLYDNLTDARNAIQDLVNAGIDRADINLVARDTQDTTITDETMVDADTGGAAVEGAVAGGVIGGLGGVLLGLGALAIPGIGPVVAAGPLVAGLVGAGLGAATGGLLGALVEWGIPESEAGYYAEGVRRGGTLVAVRVPDMQANEVADIMNRHNPTDVQRRAEAWTASGWQSYDVNAQPYTSQQIAQERSQYTAYDYDEGYEEFESYEPAFQRDYATNYAASGTPYTRYTPAYRYGYGLATDDRYHGREWNEIEMEARRDWEAQYNDAWDDFKNAVRRGWEEVKDAFDTDDAYEYDEDDAELTSEYDSQDSGLSPVSVTRIQSYTVHDTSPGMGTSGTTGTSSMGQGTAYGGFDTYRDTFRRDFDTNYGTSAYTYQHYEPAYRYGYDLGTNTRYRGMAWYELEPEARRRWEESNQGTWDQFKNAVRRGWEEVKDAFGVD
jgi:hypothetical protein